MPAYERAPAPRPTCAATAVGTYTNFRAWRELHAAGTAVSRDASRDELVKAVTDAMQGDYLDGQITVFHDGTPADNITATRSFAS